MRNLHMEPGRLYDAVTFLARYFSENPVSSTDAEPAKYRYYNVILDRISKTMPALPPIIYPFACRYDGRRPFLDTILLVGPYKKLSCSQALLVLGNEQYMHNRFIEYYFDGMSPRQVLKALDEHPAGIDLVTQMEFPPALETRIYYALIRFSDVLRTLQETFRALCTELGTEQKSFLAQNPHFARGLGPEAPNTEKLKTLAKLAGSEEPRYSFSLLDPYIISYRNDESDYILLGCEYEEVLHARYKYKTADPYSFAQAIGTPVRYEIYQALLEQSSMTRADMETRLHLSRAAIDHNLKVMRDKGLITIAHQTGLTNHYSLDPKYIQVVAQLILEQARVH